MAGSISFKLSPSVLQWARLSMGYSMDQAAKKAGVAIDRYEAWETGTKLPTYKQLEDLAENVYKRPLAILLLSSPPKEDTIQKDFRNLSNSEAEDLSPEIRFALRKAKRYQLILEEVSQLDTPAKYTDFKVSMSDNPMTASKRFREFLTLTISEQKSWKHESAFNNFKKKIEEIGIYVFQLKLPIQEARAFCLIGKFPIIVLNTDDSFNARIFSLFHEVCHVLFNVNDVFKDLESGRLNKQYKEVEEFCNQFAASFLVPDDLFADDINARGISKNNINDGHISYLSKSYNVSNEVIARKLLSLRIITEDFFWSRKRIWDAAAKSAKEREKERLKDTEGGRNQGIIIVYEKGKPYVSNVLNAYNQGIISSSDVANYLETKIDHLPKIIERLNN